MRVRTDLLKVYMYYFMLYVMVNISNKISIIAVKGELAILIAVIWMVVTIALYFLYMTKNNNKSWIIPYSSFNAIVGGITISSYYRLKNVTPYTTILLILIFGALMMINFWLINVIKRKVIFTRINIVMTIIFILSSIYVWIEKDQSLGSSLVFLIVIYLCFSIALHRVVKRSLDWGNIIPYSSLLMFGGLLLVVIAVVTEGDVLRALDAGFLGDSKSKKV